MAHSKATDPIDAGPDLWDLVLHRPQIDPGDLRSAIERQALSGDLDSRTRLLIRDGMNALKVVGKATELRNWLQHSPAKNEIQLILSTESGPVGFPSLERRLMNRTKIETVEQFLRELGARIHQPTKLYVGGSIALMMSAGLARYTEDIDIVDEIPAALRGEHLLLDELSCRYGLRLAHFQSHYLPDGWETRIHSHAKIGQMEVYLVDIYDVLTSKLLSNRGKDRDDLRVLMPQLDKHVLSERLKAAHRLLNDVALTNNARDNWYILYNQPLPPHD